MAWDTGTITSATPWPALSTKIQALFGGSGVANWSFVENIPAGTGAGQSGSASFSIDVYKCAGSGTDANDAATDWYIGLPIPSPTSGLTNSTPICCEAYDATAGEKKFKRQCPAASSTAPDANGYRNDTYQTWNAASKLAMGTFALNTTGFNYWIKLTKNLLIVAVHVGSTDKTYLFGLMDSVTAVSDSIPLVAAGDQTASSGIGFHRLPGVTGSSTNSIAWTANLLGWTRNQDGVTSNGVNANDIWQSNKVHCARILVAHRGLPISDMGYIRGLLKSDILCFAEGGTVNLGDTMVIAGNTWTVINKTIGQSPSFTFITRAN